MVFLCGLSAPRTEIPGLTPHVFLTQRSYCDTLRGGGSGTHTGLETAPAFSATLGGMADNPHPTPPLSREDDGSSLWTGFATWCHQAFVQGIGAHRTGYCYRVISIVAFVALFFLLVSTVFPSANGVLASDSLFAAGL